MTDNPQPVDPKILRVFSPLDGLKNENLRALARKTSVRELGRSHAFQAGDTEKRTFCSSRAVDLLAAAIVGPQGGRPCAASCPGLPRRCSARVASDHIEYLAIDSDLLDVLITWDQTGQYEVGELRAGSQADDDWMTLLLQSRAFHKIPPANLQAVFIRMERVNFAAGETVIRQGDEGDYFYAIVSGRCLVTRETPLNRDGIKLAELGMGDTFGEEALISGARRNATVTMVTDGMLMRLGKEDFNSLLNEPMLNWVDYEAARGIVASGGRWLDVRLPSEFEHCHFEQAINVPLYFVRLKLKSLDPLIHTSSAARTGGAARLRPISSASAASTPGPDGRHAATDLAEALNATSTRRDSATAIVWVGLSPPSAPAR
jgi:hypothetical protein